MMLEKPHKKGVPSAEASEMFIENVENLLECSLQTEWLSEKVCAITSPTVPLILLFYLPYGKRIGIDDSAGKQIIHIDQDIWLRKPTALLNRIATLAGRGKRVYARETVAARIDKKMAMDFQHEHHLQVGLPGKYRYGLFKEGELLSVAVFSGLRKMRYAENYRSIELLRFCHKGRYIIVGGLSKLLAAMERDFSPNDIMTYLDKDWSSGEKFEKIGFERKEETEPQLFKVDKRSFERCAMKGDGISLTDDDYLLANSGSIKMIIRR